MSSHVCTLYVLRRGDLLGAGDVRVRGVHRDVVLVLERRDDLAVVRPGFGEGDHVELALLLRGGHQLVEAAEVLGARRGGGVDSAGSGRIRRGRGRGRGAAGERHGQDEKGGCP
jgi:hypothetical protein